MEDLDKKIIELMDLFDDEQVTTADKIDRPEKALDKQAFDDFNTRNPMAGGGMLVQPSFGDMREGFKKDYNVKELDKATEYYTKGEFKKFSDIKGFGQGKDPEFIKKYKNIRTLIKKQLDYHDGKFKIPDKTDVKKTDQTIELEKFLKGKKTIKQSEFIKKLTELGYKNPKQTVNNIAFNKKLNIIRDVERAPQPPRDSKLYTKAQLNKASKGMFDGKSFIELDNEQRSKVFSKLRQQGGKYSKFRKINNPLSKELIKDIKTKFGNVYKDWDFDNYRFGITDAKGENSKLYDKIKRFVAEPKPYELTADFSGADGWLGSQMNRAYKLGDERYVPIKIVRNNKEKIAGFIDNTEFGGGKKYIFSEEFIKGSNADGVLMSSHPDFKETKKYRDIAKIAKLPVGGALKNILNSKGVDTSRISLSDLYKYMMNEVGIEGTKNAIEQHHVKGVGVRATGDYQLLNRDLNILARDISAEIADGNLSRVNELKEKGIRVNVGGQEFGAPKGSASSDFLKIKDDITKFYKEADVTKVKGLKSFMKANGIKCIVSRSNGGPVTCDMPQAYEKSLNQISKAANAGDSAAQSKLLNFRKAVGGAGSVIKGVLGPAAIAAEIGIAIPIGLFEYSQGKPAEEIVNTLTYGLAGKDREDRLKEEMPTYGQGDALNRAFDGFRSSLNKLGMPRDPNQLRPGKKTDDMLKTFEERKEPFMRVNPQVEEGRFFDLDMFDKNVSESRAIEQKLTDEDLKRKEERRTDPFTAYDNDFMAAKGGRAGFESGTIPGGYTDDAYAYLREIDDEIFNAYKKYKAGGGRLKYGPYAYNAKRAMFGAFGIGVPKAYQRKAEGGIIGDKSGPPPERGPNSQGLQGLLNRVKKIKE